MREIEFRAWNKDLNKFVAVEVLSFVDTDEYIVGHRTVGNQLRHMKCKKLFEYTGLKDKNGQKIFEGDILYWDGSIIGSVKFEHCEFIVGEGVNARAMCSMPDDLEIKIIGNIYANPSLLEGE